MSKKTATIIITVFVLFIVGGFLAFYFYTNRGWGGGIVPPDNTTGVFPPTPGQGTGYPDTSSNGEGNTGYETPSEGSQVTALLKELSTRPSAGAGWIATTSPVTSVRFVERGTGNVYEVGPETSGEIRVTNTTIPKISEAFFNRDAGQFIARYTKDGEVDTIQSYYAKITPPTDASTGSSLKGSFLTENIKFIVPNPELNKIFYLVAHSNGSTGVISEFDGAKKTQVFDSLVSEWLPQWVNSSTVALTTKPSSRIPGFLFLLNTKNGVLSRAISGVKGLTTLVNPSGSSVLYSESTATGMVTKIYNLKTNATVETSVQTLPEKCLWSKVDPAVVYCAVPYYLSENSYPDAWYQGRVSFGDDIWKIDATTGVGTLLSRLKIGARRDIDATNLFTTAKEDYLFFTDKNDSHVWSLKI